MSLIEREPTRDSRFKEVFRRSIRSAKDLLRLDDTPDEQEAALRLQASAKAMRDIVEGGFYTQRKGNASGRKYHLFLKGASNKNIRLN